jgi:hypothetical protein
VSSPRSPRRDASRPSQLVNFGRMSLIADP